MTGSLMIKPLWKFGTREKKYHEELQDECQSVPMWSGMRCMGMIFQVLREEKGRTDDEVERKTFSKNPGR